MDNIISREEMDMLLSKDNDEMDPKKAEDIETNSTTMEEILRQNANPSNEGNSMAELLKQNAAPSNEENSMAELLKQNAAPSDEGNSMAELLKQNTAPSNNSTKHVFQDFNDTPVNKKIDDEKLGLILDIPLEISVVLGKTKKSIREITDIVPGSVVELDKAVEAPLEIYANGKKVAEGEAVAIDEKFCVRITKIVSKRELFSGL